MKTIRDAVAGLPANVQQHLINQFNRCGIPDVYDGDLDMYLLVIEQETQQAFDALLSSVDVLERLQAAILGLRPRRSATPVEPVVLQIRARRVFYLPATVEEARDLEPS